MNAKYVKEVMMGHEPYEKEADAVMDREDYREYVSVHGYHFSEKMAEYAISKLVNADGSIHRWSVRDAATAMAPLPGGWTAGDAAYLLNWLYSDLHVPEGIQTDAGIVAYAKRYMKDPDGYEGMTFMRWVSDRIGCGETVEWDKYI
jgi:hypothetical protein